MGDLEAVAVTDPICEHGEGPVWHPGWPGLRWVDMFAGDVLTLDARSGEVRRDHVGALAAALRPRAGGGVVLAAEAGFELRDDELALERALPPLWSDPDVRMNDGGCDPFGRFYCGSMHRDARAGVGHLYRLDPDGTAEPVLDGLTISNGIDFSPDGTRAYLADSPTGRVDVFDYDEHAGLSGRRRFVELPDSDGWPDGIVVDAAGNVWVALWGGSAVRRYSPAGELTAVIELPARQVTACTLGGPDLRTLFVTTSRHGLDPAVAGPAGSLFAVGVDTPGRPTPVFAG